MDSIKKLSEKEVQEMITRIAKKLETLKGKYPHFKKFNVKEAIEKNTISYQHNIQWKPNPNYKQEVEEWEKAPLPTKAEPLQMILLYSEKDGISLRIDFYSKEERRTTANEVLDIGNTLVEFEIKGAKTKEIDDIREFVSDILKEEAETFVKTGSSSQTKPLTKEEIDSRLQDIEMKSIRQVMVPPPSKAGTKPKIISFDDPKKRETLYQSQDRREQEELLREMEKSLKEKYDAADLYTREQLEKDIKAFKKQCEEMVEEAKKKVSKGQDKQKVLDQIAKDLRDLHKEKQQSWKGWWSEGEANVEEYIQKLEKDFKLKSIQGSDEQKNYDLIEANNRFTFDLYAKLKEEEGNLFFSPFSILAAFAMTVEGARGKTKEEIQKVFHFPKDISLLRSTFSTLYTQLNRKDAPYKLHTANALWVQKGLGLLKNYQELVRQFYGGEARNIDFSKAQKAAKMINTWIEEKTHHKISGFFSPESFSKLTWLVLTNAIYFKGMWEIPFDKEQTKEEEFQIHKDKKIKVPMMRLEDRELKFQYAETEKLQLLEMPYKGDELSMLLLLPKNNDLKALETKLTLEKLKTWKGQTKYEHVFIYLPKFIFKRKYKLHPTLSHMGMPTSFTTSADFSGIFGKLDIFIDSVLHEAFVDVNEEGTEAAAATALSDALSELLLEGPRLFTFRADHPFLFFIQERRTGNILFMGRVEEPVFEAK